MRESLTINLLIVFLKELWHRAAITLHNPYIDFNDSNNISTARCVNATRSILAAYYRLSETSVDICRLHPFVTVCAHLWSSLAGGC